MIPDDRLTSAVYTLLHWMHGGHGEPEDDDLIVKLPGSFGKTHFLIVGARHAPAGEED